MFISFRKNTLGPNEVNHLLGGPPQKQKKALRMETRKPLFKGISPN